MSRSLSESVTNAHAGRHEDRPRVMGSYWADYSFDPPMESKRATSDTRSMRP